MDGDIAHQILKILGEGQSKVLTQNETGQIVVLLSRSIELVETFASESYFVGSDQTCIRLDGEVHSYHGT